MLACLACLLLEKGVLGSNLGKLVHTHNATIVTESFPLVEASYPHGLSFIACQESNQFPPFPYI